MRTEHNELGQPIGRRLEEWAACQLPPHVTLNGRYCRLEPLQAGHAEALHAANSLDAEGRSWTYLPYGPFASFDEYAAWIESQRQKKGVLLYAIVDLATEKAVGLAGYLRPDPDNGVIEIGHLNFSPLLQQTRAATEALYLLAAYVFRCGYRRCEWKCNDLNEASRRAALRLGFQFEGIFRQLLVVKGRNRDTAWFSILDGEWPALNEAFETWLAADNFDDRGRQKLALSVLTANARSVLA
ncbi:GNAT family protein [Uliginosibacterium sp. H3]|uniref:GNAT family protein n=1 Tax=Uliginosibacterium silvisoli TaxID=3114758 RepID=A0ABU6JY07_9RHOO|nr:GNAT family protein [Uliginosibacterium sp. H3]